MRTTRLLLGPLHCHVLLPEQQRPEMLVTLCHGFGASGDDLTGLASALRHHLGPLADKVAFVFPEAPLSLAAMGMPGRAWWPIDIERLSSPAGAKAGLQKMRESAPEGLAFARKSLRETLEAALQHLNLSYGQMMLGGFSQGAMVSTDVVLRLEEAPAALAILSGTLIDEAQWRRRAPMRRGLHVVQSHGKQDPILPFSAAIDLRDLLLSAGLDVDWGAFDGGHTIEDGMLTRMAARLRLAFASL